MFILKEDATMHVKIIEGCIGCGLCASTCPDVFRMGEEGTAEVYQQPGESCESGAEEAAENCPVSVIITE